ncbi:MAG: hypothetical protein Q8936_23680 [Bacillota bacterium]|nr:hypothetical protein [Bacillota bacterium]
MSAFFIEVNGQLNLVRCPSTSILKSYEFYVIIWKSISQEVG